MNSGMRLNPAALVSAILLSVGIARAAEPLQSRVLLDGKVTMLVPQNLTFMSEADKRERYPGRNAPAYVLTNEDWSVNLAFDHKQVPMKPTQVGELEKPMFQQLSGAKINSSGVRKVNGIDFLVIDADMDMPDEARLHNLITVTSLEGRMLVISYNCLLNFDPACAGVGPRMMQSIVLTPTAVTK
jgi:hypothetical protein